MTPLNPRERKLVALALLIAAVTLLLFGIVMPVVGGFVDRAAERRALLAEYARNARLIAALPLWRTQLENEKRSAAQGAMTASSDINASEQLKDRLNRAAMSLGGGVKAVETLPGDSGAGHAVLRAELTLAQMIDVLRGLQNETPVTVIEGLKINADKSLASGRLSSLDVEIEASAPYIPAPAR